MHEFSLNETMLSAILREAKPLGHNEQPRNLNLGFGFLYYGLVRALRPKHTLVIGSGHGFSVVCLALGIRDNGSGRLTFVDPSYALLREGPFGTIGGAGKWDEPEDVKEHFKKFGVDEIVTHYRMRSDELFAKYQQMGLPPIDLAFVDGNHAYGDVKHDFVNVVKRSRKNTYLFLHDTNIYVREMLHHAGVKRWLNILKRERKAFEIMDFPFSSGVALVRILEPKVWEHLE